MKRNKLVVYLITPLLLIGASCDDFGDINVSPNASTVPLTSALLTNAQSALGAATTGGANFQAGLYCQYFSETQYTDNSLYSAADVNWAGDMFGSMMDYENIIKINTDPVTAAAAALQGPNANQIAISRILKAYRFSILTDRYGDIPYFGALKGQTQPIIDSQEDVYNDLFKELKEAVAQFNTFGIVKGDIIYSGDNLKWKRFANSLRVILALRISEINPTKGAQEVNDALSSDGGVFASNADNAVLNYPGASFRNPWFALGADQGVSEIVANHVNKDNDLRKNAFGKPVSGTLKGFPYGLTRDQAIAWNAIPANAGWSLILNDAFRAQASPNFILTYADVLLARAQAAHYGWTTESTNTMYTEALRASWEQWGVYDAPTFAAYIADPDIALTPATENEKIATQRWLTFYPNGTQGWSEWRRTGFPVLTPTVNAVNPTKTIPIRFPFPSVEYNYNETNIAAAVTRMGGSDKEIDNVWWDVD